MSALTRTLLAVSLAFNVAIGASYAHRIHASSSAARTSAAAALNLSTEQQSNLSAMQEELRAGARLLRQNSGAALNAMARTLADPRPDPEQVRALLDQHGRGRTDLQMAMIESLLAFRDTLEPEQQRAFNRSLERPGFLRDLAGFGLSETSPGVGP